jgi:hypothetical protein
MFISHVIYNNSLSLEPFAKSRCHPNLTAKKMAFEALFIE